MTKKKRIEEIKKLIKYHEGLRDANVKKVNGLKDSIYKLQIESKMKAMVGRCFKYRNSYGSHSEDWWLYARVIGYKNKTLTVCRFEITSINQIEINTSEEVINLDPLKHHLFQIPITKKQFNANLNRTIKKLESMKE